MTIAYINEQVFEQLNQSSEYWIGIMATNATIENSDKHRIRLSSYDITDLEKFKAFTQSEHKIGKTNKGLCTFEITPKIIADKMKVYGITGEKDYLNIENEQLLKSRHFWRGTIDGDGCIRTAKNKRKFLALASNSLEFLQQFRSFADNVLNTNKITTVSIMNKCYLIQYCDKKCKRLLSELYENINLNCVYDRKLEKAIDSMYGDD